MMRRQTDRPDPSHSFISTPHRAVAAIAVLVGAVLAGWVACAANDPGVEYLSDPAVDRISSIEQGWGELGLDTSVRPGNRPPMKLRIKDTEYARGLGHHANGQIEVDLDGQFKTFVTEVGIQWQGGQNLASVVFQVFVDDKKVYDSGVVREADPPRPVSISVEGADTLRLVATDAGDGITCDCADWAEARLVRNPAAPKAAPESALDIAPFGQVVTSDPQVMQGTRASRVEEMPAADIYSVKPVQPRASGGYTVPVWNGTGCVGLQWAENRLLKRVALRFATAGSVPAGGSVQLQYWAGESAWQGEWKRCETAPEQTESSLVWALGSAMKARGTQKVRWLFSKADQPVVAESLAAFTRGRWKPMQVRLGSTRPSTALPAEIEVYNGLLLNPPGGSPYRCSWDGTKPLTLTVRSSLPQRYKADRTVLRLRSGDSAFGVALEDLLSNDCVYVPHAGLFVTREPAPVSLEAYLKAIAGKETVREEVGRRPDQDFTRAWEVVHNPIQDLGPMLVSLACDNRKFEVHREGRVLFAGDTRPDDPRRVTDYAPGPWQLVPRWGRGGKVPVTRHLQGSWLPVPVTSAREGNVSYQQSTGVVPVGPARDGAPAWYRERAFCEVDYVIKNEGATAEEARLELSLVGDPKQAFELREAKEGLLAVSEGRVLGVIDTRAVAPLQTSRRAGGLQVGGLLPAGASVKCEVRLPAWRVEPEAYEVVLAEKAWLPSLESYWRGLLEPAMQVELPDRFLTDLIRASQVHCLLAARCEEGGARVAPWIGSDRYGPLESEANAVIRGMDMSGQTDFARRSLEYFLHRCNQAGFITTGYTLVGTGEFLWTLGEHCGRAPDRGWVRQIAPEVARISQWIIRQRSKTKQLDVRGQKVPEYGLMPPGVTADWGRFAYRFYNDAQYCAGLEAAARLLAQAGEPSAAAVEQDARGYRADITRAFHWAQARTPVVRLQNGTWVPGDPALLDCYGRVEDFLPSEDGNRTWAYSVDVGAHHLAATRILEPLWPDVSWMADYLEDVQFLRSGMGDYPEERNRKDIFNLGGFGKLQPYYGRMAEVYGLRDEVKPFVRSYFNTIPTLVSRENLSFWEHFHNTGGWNKTHETGWFLCQTRTMFVTERGDELWLAPFVTTHWLEDGMRVAVCNAPSRFGPVGYMVTSKASQGRIEAVVELPPATSAKRVVLRLRHPAGKPMRAAFVQDQPTRDFDVQRETISLPPQAGTIRVRAEY
jgi:hypothetical protein